MNKKVLIVIAVALVALGGGYFYVIGSSMTGGAFFVETDSIDYSTAASDDVERELEVAQFAGGCFWCVEADFEKLEGVVDVVSGYAGGTNENPTYQTYSKNGHREVVEVTYDPNVVSYEELTEYLLRHIDPLDPEGSFYDRGYGYTSAIFYETEEEKEIAENVIARIDEMGVFPVPIVTAVEPIAQFWPAEDFHQDYYKKNAIRYNFYRTASGRDDFIDRYWGDKEEQELSSEHSGANDRITMIDMLNKEKYENFEKPTDEVLRTSLTPIQYKVTQKDGTERAFSNEYFDNKEDGLYVDVVSGEPLFSSRDKFDSGTGWPSFTKPISPNAVTEHIDRKLIFPRTEIRSRYADSHLGHVFNDAPAELGGIRYCMNSASLRFIPVGELEKQGYGDYRFLFE